MDPRQAMLAEMKKKQANGDRFSTLAWSAALSFSPVLCCVLSSSMCLEFLLFRVLPCCVVCSSLFLYAVVLLFCRVMFSCDTQLITALLAGNLKDGFAHVDKKDRNKPKGEKIVRKKAPAPRKKWGDNKTKVRRPEENGRVRFD